MLTNPSDAAIVQLLVQLGRALNIPVTAEGVETSDQLRHLTDIGCPNVQGYYLARPTDATTFTSWLINHHTTGTSATPARNSTGRSSSA
jgi:EAL domain-containing protein (putative c-di-GMP-specific phosphodiesterase class I)